jgi:poly(beta-D-mannuronate) lyase
MIFRAHAAGVTTENSDYPRSELREMAGSREAAWSSRAGTHVLTISQAITATPVAKPHVVAGQIHDGDDDVLAIRLEGRRLFVDANGRAVGVLDANYRLGTRFIVVVSATPNGIRVTYNGSRAVRVPRVGTGWYFKAGCYVQSNPSQGDRPHAYGEVVIYDLNVRHSAPARRGRDRRGPR